MTEIELAINRIKEDNDKYTSFCTALHAILSPSVPSASVSSDVRPVRHRNNMNKSLSPTSRASPSGRSAPMTPFSPKGQGQSGKSPYGTTPSSVSGKASGSRRERDSGFEEDEEEREMDETKEEKAQEEEEKLFDFIAKLRNDLRQCNLLVSVPHPSQHTHNTSSHSNTSMQYALSSYWEYVIKCVKRVQEVYDNQENQLLLARDEINTLQHQLEKQELMLTQWKQQRLYADEKHKVEVSEDNYSIECIHM